MTAGLQTIGGTPIDEAILSIKVTDTGIGISEQDLKDLFKPFFRSKEKINKEYNKNGNGLGLYIC